MTRKEKTKLKIKIVFDINFKKVFVLVKIKFILKKLLVHLCRMFTTSPLLVILTINQNIFNNNKNVQKLQIMKN